MKVLPLVVLIALVVPSTAQSKPHSYWIKKQIAVANKIASSATVDPWPNCPDPYFQGRRYSWWDTVKCENRGMYERYGFPRAWMDSPGFYRCGLQFHPNWEKKYGRLCP